MLPHPDIKRDTMVTLIVPGVVASALFWFLAGYCPGAIDSLKSGGHFPTQFRVFASVYNILRPCFPFIIPIVAGHASCCGSVPTDSRTLFQVWVWGVTLVGTLSITFSIWALSSAY